MPICSSPVAGADYFNYILSDLTDTHDGGLKFWYTFVMEDAYKNDFEKFLSHTDEKQVLLDTITDYIRENNVTSLLDIGAGNGLLSIPLAKMVSHYVAVEENENFALKLRESGLKTIEATFPTNVDGSFDLVLSSHSIPHEKELYEQFIKKAWKLVRPNGVFLVITFNRDRYDWANLLQELKLISIDKNKVGYTVLVELLKSIGKVRTWNVTTRVVTENLDDMVNALSFVASDGNEEIKREFLDKSEQIREIIKISYKEGMGYAFPFQHIFVSTHKSN